MEICTRQITSFSARSIGIIVAYTGLIGRTRFVIPVELSRQILHISFEHRWSLGAELVSPDHGMLGYAVRCNGCIHYLHRSPALRDKTHKSTATRLSSFRRIVLPTLEDGLQQLASIAFATRLKLDCKLRRKARSLTFRSARKVGWTSTTMWNPFISPCEGNNFAFAFSVCGHAPSCWNCNTWPTLGQRVFALDFLKNHLPHRSWPHGMCTSQLSVLYLASKWNHHMRCLSASNTPSLPMTFWQYTVTSTETSSKTTVSPMAALVRTWLRLVSLSRVKLHNPNRPSKLYSGLGFAHTARNMIFGILDLWKTFGAAGHLYFQSLLGKTRHTCPSCIKKKTFFIRVYHGLEVSEVGSVLVNLIKHKLDTVDSVSQWVSAWCIFSFSPCQAICTSWELSLAWRWCPARLLAFQSVALGKVDPSVDCWFWWPPVPLLRWTWLLRVHILCVCDPIQLPLLEVP